MRRRSEIVPPASAVPSEGTFNKLGEAREFAKILKALLPFVSQDITRPSISSLYVGFSPGVLDVVATDGHRLARWHETERDITEHGHILLSREDVERLVKLHSRNHEGDLAVNMKKRLFTTASTSQEVKEVVAIYPRYEQVMPKHDAVGDRTICISVSPQYLAEACDAFTTVAKGRKDSEGNQIIPYVTMTATGGDADPIRLTSRKHVPELTVIIMPVRA